MASCTQVRRQLSHVLTVGHSDPATALAPLAELLTDPSAARVVTDAGRTIGRVLADLVNWLNPALIVMGGKLGAAGDALVVGVRESIARYAQPASAQAVAVRPAVLGARSGLYGAFTAARASTTTAP